MHEKDDIPLTGDAVSAPPMGSDDAEKPSANKGLAKFDIGQSVQHRKFGFQGVIFDVDPEFGNTEEWYQAIPEDVRPSKDQPFYHLFAVNPADNSPYVAYVSQQNLVPLPDGEEVLHPQLEEYFVGREGSTWVMSADRFN